MKVSKEVFNLVEAVKQLESHTKMWNNEFFMRCLEAYEQGTLEQVDSSRVYTVTTPHTCYYGLPGILVQQTEDTVLLEFELSEAAGGTHRVLFKKDQVRQVLTEKEVELSQSIIKLIDQGHKLSLYNRLLTADDTIEDIKGYILDAMIFLKRDIDAFVNNVTEEEKNGDLLAESSDYFHSKDAFFDMTFSHDETEFVKVLPQVDFKDGSFDVNWSLCNHTLNQRLHLYAKDEDFFVQFQQLLVELETTKLESSAT